MEIYTGFAVDEILYKDGKVIGAKTKDTGMDHHGNQLENFQAGTRIEAKITIFAEGTRGSLTKMLIKKFNLTRTKTSRFTHWVARSCGQFRKVILRPVKSTTPWAIRSITMNLAVVSFMA